MNGAAELFSGSFLGVKAAVSDACHCGIIDRL